jgi:hypothetical protein
MQQHKTHLYINTHGDLELRPHLALLQNAVAVCHYDTDMMHIKLKDRQTF